MLDNTADIVMKNNKIEAAKNTRKKHPEPFILKFLQTLFQSVGRLSPALAGRFAYKLWLTPTRFKTPGSEQKALQSATIEFHKVAGKDIATFSWGPDNSPVILMVHGWGGRGTQLGAFVPPLLEAGYRVISFDAPAHGQSSGKQTTLYEISDTVLAMQEIFGDIDSVITHSFGGPCTALAITHGLKTGRFISICPPATTIGLIDKFSETLHLLPETRQRLVHRMELNFGNHIWEQLSMQNLVRDIDTPGLVIHDTDDEDIPLEEGQAVAKAWNEAPLITTSGLGHRRILRDSFVIESAIRFINQR